MNKMSVVFRIALILSFLLAGCAAAPAGSGSFVPNWDMFVLTRAATFQGVATALKEGATNEIFIKDNYVVITWFLKEGQDGVGMWAFDTSKLTQVADVKDAIKLFGMKKGQAISIRSAYDLENFLINAGFKVTTAAGLAEATKDQILMFLAVSPMDFVPLFVLTWGEMPWTVEQLEQYYNPKLKG